MSVLTTISSHFFGNHMNIFHKTGVKTVILRCWTGLKLNWFNSYDTNAKNVKMQLMQKIQKIHKNEEVFTKKKWKQKYVHTYLLFVP